MDLYSGARAAATKNKRVCNSTSRGPLFAIIIGASGLSILALTYYTDIINITSTFTVERVLGLTEYGNLKSVWTNNNNNTTDQEQFEDNDTVLSPINTTSSVLLWNQQHHNVPENGKLSTVLVTNSSRVLQNRSSAQANNSYHTFTEVQSGTTTMTFNTTLVVHCMKSPYIECTHPKVTAADQKTYKISILKLPAWLNMSNFAMGKCQYNQCIFEEKTVTMETDVVFVHDVRFADSFKPPERWPHQIYVLALWESPMNVNTRNVTDDKSVWKNQFNLTMTYRLEDIFTPVNLLRFRPQPLDKRPNYYEIAKRKAGTAVWLVSNCHAQSKRSQYVTQMQKYVDVDILGGCNGRRCISKGWLCGNISKYKFYLSFENSLCRDYVTEKYFKLFVPGMHVIPVVRGGADYDKYFPKFTYINAADFKSPKDLALYLKDLASDLETYSKYLEYMDLYVIEYSSTFKACSLCNYLHTHKLSEKKQYNFSLWDNDCHSPSDL